MAGTGRVRFAANLTYLFREVAFLERFAQAAEAGFEAVEFHYPYDEEPGRVREAAKASGLPIVQSSVASGDRSRGEWGLAALPDAVDAFRGAVVASLALAQRLEIAQLHAPAGIVGPEIPWQQAWETYLANLAWAADEAAKAGVRLLIEPINDRDTPGYFLPRTALARRAIDTVGSANLFLQVDCYHATVMAEGALAVLAENLALTRHIQISGYPGRHEPAADQSIDYPAIFRLLAEGGYAGWIGCEYRPRGETVAGLGWLRSARGGRAGIP
jgi:hydroxypyruvate isomerase